MTVHQSQSGAGTKVPRKDSQTMKTRASSFLVFAHVPSSGTDRDASEAHCRPACPYLNFGNDCLVRPMVAQGSFRRREMRCIRFCTVYWSADFRLPSSDHSIGTDTGAPGRPRAGYGATA